MDGICLPKKNLVIESVSYKDTSKYRAQRKNSIIKHINSDGYAVQGPDKRRLNYYKTMLDREVLCLELASILHSSITT